LESANTKAFVEQSHSEPVDKYKRPVHTRYITPEAGYAIEKLGHAIDYLADELVDKGTLLSPNDDRVQAIQILMALNREVYFECPNIQTVGERFHAFLGRFIRHALKKEIGLEVESAMKCPTQLHR
jgi:hypothetical protein